MIEGVSAIIIEDDQLSVEVLQSLLEQSSVISTIISSNVLEHLHSIPIPHIIFLDLEMPHKSGYEVIEYLQSDPDLANVPVVAYTTHTSHMNEAREAGFHSFLGKPLKRQHFPKQLQRILSGEPVWEVS